MSAIELMESWIAEQYPTPQSASLQCAEATLAMLEAFPLGDIAHAQQCNFEAPRLVGRQAVRQAVSQ